MRQVMAVLNDAFGICSYRFSKPASEASLESSTSRTHEIHLTHLRQTGADEYRHF